MAQTAVYADKAQIVITELKIEYEPAVLDKENQVYKVRMSLVMNNSGSGYEDNISIRVTAGESEFVIPVVYGQESYSIEVTAKPGDEIKAVVSGTQVLPEGVYFYSPKATDIDGDGVATGREVSQNMVGVAMGKTAVYAEDSVSFEDLTIYEPVHTLGSITVTKNASGADTPADTSFQLQRLDGDTWTDIGTPVAFSNFVNNAYTFTALEEGTYRVVESGAEVDGFTLTTSYSENVILTKTTANNGDTSINSDDFTVTNVYEEDPQSDETIEIPEEDVPLASAPSEEEKDDLVEIPDEDVPLADVPKTGDLILHCSGMAIISGIATICVRMTGKKKEEYEEE